MAIEVNNPTSKTKWKRGTEYIISWTGGDPEYPVYTIELYKGGVYRQTICDDEWLEYNYYPWTPGLFLDNGLDYQIWVSDGVTSDFSDEFLIYGDVTVKLNENLGLGDNIGREFDWVKVLSDNLTLGDSIVIIKDIVKILSDNLTLSDSITRKFDWVKVLSDDLTLNDSIIRSIFRTLSDDVSLSDSIIKSIAKILSDNLSLSDSILRSILRVLSDNLTLNDSLVKSIIKVLSDNLTLNDSLVKKIDKVLSDNLSLSDSIIVRKDVPGIFTIIGSTTNRDNRGTSFAKYIS